MALKVMSKSPILAEGAERNLQREVVLHSRLIHPNILGQRGYFHNPKSCFIILGALLLRVAFAVQLGATLTQICIFFAGRVRHRRGVIWGASETPGRPAGACGGSVPDATFERCTPPTELLRHPQATLQRLLSAYLSLPPCLLGEPSAVKIKYDPDFWTERGCLVPRYFRSPLLSF